MEILTTGESSHTDIAMCYMEGRADKKLIETIKKRIQNVKVDALSMNQEGLAECIFPGKWFNPFPKFKFSERPDTSAASILEGNIVILVDNSPSAMILPSSVFDIIEEADDYYFPPVTGTYLRLSRMLISLLSMLLTPTWLMLMQNTELIPHWLRFIRLSDPCNIPLIWQLLILEFAIIAFSKAGPNFVQCFKSFEVATARRGTLRFHCVYSKTYVPSSVIAIRGSSVPPGHSFST